MEKSYSYEGLKKEISKEGWIKAGYTEKGQLIQYNTKTKKTRVLDEWVEIYKK